MAREIILKFNKSVSSFEISKVDRKSLYCFKKRIKGNISTASASYSPSSFVCFNAYANRLKSAIGNAWHSILFLGAKLRKDYWRKCMGK